jgi:phage shock protein A
MKTNRILCAVLLSAAFFAGCSSAKKAAAEAAIKAGDTAFAPIAAEAEKYVPDQAKAFQDSMQQAKTNLANGDYTAALETSKDLPGKAKDLTEAVKAKKEELTSKWNEMSSTMPGLVSAVQSRMDTLKKTHRLPSGANDAFASLQQSWNGASSSFQSGDLSSAMQQATAAKEKLAEVQKTLGMKPVS